MFQANIWSTLGCAAAVSVVHLVSKNSRMLLPRALITPAAPLCFSGGDTYGLLPHVHVQGVK